MGRNFTLVQAVITQLTVYWAHLYQLPSTIIKKIDGITTNFILSGMRQRKKYHLSKLHFITLPKKMGGWGILDLRRFGHALLLKFIWCGIFGTGIWSQFINQKYMKNIGFKVWLRLGHIEQSSDSTIWHSFSKIGKTFLEMLAWKLGIRHHIIIGRNHIRGLMDMDPFLDCII